MGKKSISIFIEERILTKRSSCSNASRSVLDRLQIHDLNVRHIQGNELRFVAAPVCCPPQCLLRSHPAAEKSSASHSGTQIWCWHQTRPCYSKCSGKRPPNGSLRACL